MIQIYSASLDLLCIKSWDANSIYKNPIKNNKLCMRHKKTKSLEICLYCTCIYGIFYFHMNFYKMILHLNFYQKVYLIFPTNPGAFRAPGRWPYRPKFLD